jgi:histidinol-phosphate aminotransferase
MPHSTQSGIDFLGLNRYPDPHQHELKAQLCALRNTKTHTSKTIGPENLFVGVGSDEAIDALIRAFCKPGENKILTCPPTYGMYSVSACVNDVGIVKVPLKPAPTFDLDVEAMYKTLEEDKSVKLTYICSPGNPTGSLIPKEQVKKILDQPTYNGIVVLDEAYIDFAPENSSLAELVSEYPNLVVLQTLSKAFGLAGIRLGAAFASAEVAGLLNAMKAPYNIPEPTSVLARQATGNEGLAVMRKNVAELNRLRDVMLSEVGKIAGIGRLRGGTASNFLLMEILNEKGEPDNVTALAVYEKLAGQRGVVVRFRGKEHGCLGCLRITVGTQKECERFLEEIKQVIQDVWNEHAGPKADEEEREEAESKVIA